MQTIQDQLDHFSRRDFLYEGQAYQDFLQCALRLVGSEFGYFHLYDSDTSELHLTVWSNAVLQHCTTSHDGHYSISKAGIWADSIRQNKTVVHNDYEAMMRKGSLPEGHFRLSRHMSTPIRQGDRVVAVIGAGNRELPYLDAEISNWESFVQRGFPILQQKVEAIGIRRIEKNLQLKNEDVQELLIGMVTALTQASSLRDEYTALHEKHVSELSVEIGKQLGMSEHELLGLRLGGLVHDIGKMAVPSEILNKIGELLPAEIAMIRTHPEMGAKIFAHLRTPWPLIEMIEQHHERIDGSGYPKGLRNEQIALEARIIAVADVYDSMSTNRPYRFAPGHQAACQEIQAGRGILYDPYVVDAFFQYINASTPFAATSEVAATDIEST